jgi:hypothetical protein
MLMPRTLPIHAMIQAACLIFLTACGATTDQLRERPQDALSIERVMTTIRVLASNDFAGRKPNTIGSKKAQAYIINKFRRAGIGPVPGSTYRQKMRIGTNVMGWLPGRGPLADEIIIVGAHYDHLGLSRRKMHLGANDNASGVSAMLAAVRAISLLRPSEHRSLLVVAFDSEELGLVGSKYFAKNPPVPLVRVAAVVVLDMIGRRAHPAFGNMFAVMGTEKSPQLKKAVDRVSPVDGIRVVRMGIHLIENTPFGKYVPSDYGPFYAAGIPFAFLTAGLTDTYHLPVDTVDTLTKPLLRGATTWLYRYLQDLLTMPNRPEMVRNGQDLNTDLRLLAESLRRALDPVTGMKGDLVRPSFLQRHLSEINNLRRRLARAETLSPLQLRKIHRASFRIFCYCGGKYSLFARACNRF